MMETTVIVVEARNLDAKDSGGTSDPYCIVGVMDNRTGDFFKNKVWKSTVSNFYYY